MPVVMDPRHYERWPDAPEPMRAYPGNPWVNEARHDEARRLDSATRLLQGIVAC